jgi:hypothetical protein
VWSLRPFEAIQASPDAKDLLQSSYEFAAEMTTKTFADFEALLAEVLQPQVRKKAQMEFSSAQIAHILAAAVLGFKESAKTSAQLRELIAGLITIMLASLDNPQERRKRSSKN